MAYRWEEPFVVDDRRLREKFALVPTALEAGVPAMLGWALQQHGPRKF